MIHLLNCWRLFALDMYKEKKIKIYKSSCWRLERSENVWFGAPLQHVRVDGVPQQSRRVQAAPGL
jgi:hypothetical protein